MVGPITLGSKHIVGTFNAYRDNSTTYPVGFAYTYDINGDGTDEIVFAGFETNELKAGTYSNTNVEIYGWVNGKLQSITAQWLPNGTNQVQGVGDIGFGDFNRDGKVDMFLSGFTDRDLAAEVYVMINKGSYFQRVSLGSEKYQHGIAVGDINKDGYDDVYASNFPTTSIYWGGPNGLTKSVTTGGWGVGMGAVLGDFLGNGTVSVIVTDNNSTRADDNTLFSIAVNNGVATLTKVSSLPQPLLVNSANGIKSHDVRVESLDFNNDGKLDVILFSRAKAAMPNPWPESSRIQFYKNTGSGTFEDVTSTMLSGYTIDSNVAYSPVFRDFNGDGKIDIFLSDNSFGDVHDSTTMLIQQSNGTFVDTARSILSSAVSPNGGIATVAKGPDGNYYLITSYEEVWKPGVPTIITEQQIIWPTTVVKTPVVVAPVVVAPVATYALSSGSTSVNEGATATFTLTTTNVASGTAVPYTLSGINASDITGSALTGSVAVNSSGTATITVNIVADSLTEGAETLTVTAGGTSAVTKLNDTSTTPVPTYALSSSNAVDNEGATVTFTLTTTNVAAGTSIPYTLSGVNAADVLGGLLTGSATVNSSGVATISVGIVADSLTEGTETLSVTAQSKTASIIIADTSTTPVVITPVVAASVVAAPVVTTFDVAVSNKPWGSLYQAFNAGNPGHSNQQTGSIISLSGYLQVSETINGNGTSGVLKVTNNHIAIVLDDDCNSHFTNQNVPRISGVSRIELANGDNLVDLTSTRYSVGDITIVGGKDADIIWSSSGNDTLIGGLGKNTLYGGAGKDHFVFNVALNDVSTIMDFEHGIDHIDLDRAIFTKFTAGQSIDSNIAFGLDKQTANSFIVYDSGVVYYDIDGAGGQSPVAVAKLIGAPTLTAADFLIL